MARSLINQSVLPARLYRLHFGDRPLELTERTRAFASPGRWSDPQGEYRVMYFSDCELGTYIETLQNMRQSLTTVKRLTLIVDEGGFDDPVPDVHAAATAKLQHRRLTAYIPTSPGDVVLNLETPNAREACGQLVEKRRYVGR